MFSDLVFCGFVVADVDVIVVDVVVVVVVVVVVDVVVVFAVVRVNSKNIAQNFTVFSHSQMLRGL